MKDKFIQELKLEEKTAEEQNIELIKSVIKTKLELDTVTKNFEQADDELIDYYTYQIKANQAKLDYLLKKIIGHEIRDVTEKIYTHRTTEELINEANKIIFI